MSSQSLAAGLIALVENRTCSRGSFDLKIEMKNNQNAFREHEVKRVKKSYTTNDVYLLWIYFLAITRLGVAAFKSPG